MSNVERRAAYLQKLKDPKWQRRRLEIMQRDEFTCTQCDDTTSTLNVHHKYYRWGAEPWEYPDEALATLCETCHREETESFGRRREVEREIIELIRVENFSPDAVLALLGAIAYHRTNPRAITTAICEATPDLSVGEIQVIVKWEEQPDAASN